MSNDSAPSAPATPDAATRAGRRATPGTKPSAVGTTERSRFRTDIQALRALAIAAVVLAHLWPGRFTGGYVGVDVFFVISGFLITGHLFGELQRTGRVRLGAFYARRVRRLLPAALTVLLISAVLVALFLPYPRWERNAIEIGASAAYFENWYLAAMSVDYGALDDSATVAQHYWSLSVEEQFYLIWPLLMLAAVWWSTARRTGRSLRRHAFIALAVVGLISLVASIAYTNAQPNQAYFVTFTRAWEFAVGGILALGASRLRLPRGWAQALSAIGLAAIVFAIFVYDGETPFPGIAAAVPVLGTAAIIAAGTGQRRLWHTPITASSPVQWLGGISYSLYLWHWPLIVIAPFALQQELSTVTRVGILVAAVVLAWLTRIFIESPGQRWRWWRDAPRRAFAGMAAGMVVVLLAAGALFAGFSAQSADDIPEAALPAGSCVGPAAMANAEACPDRFGPAESVTMTAANIYYYVPPDCGPPLEILVYGDKQTARTCDFSDGAADATDVWFVGDSHAQQWQGAIFELGRQNNWRVTMSFFGGCPAAEVVYRGFRTERSAEEIADCMEWSRDLSDAVIAAEPDLVITSNDARKALVDDGSGRPAADQLAEGFVADWTRWADTGAEVVVIADPPLNREVRSPDCVALNPVSPLECARPRADAQPPDPQLQAVELAGRADIRAIDLTDRFCDAETCYAVIGGVPVYYDANHLNLQYVRMLAPILGEQLPTSG